MAKDKISRFINGCGIELEGAWVYSEGFQGMIVHRDGLGVHKDSSVKVNGEKVLQKYVNKPKYGSRSLQTLLETLKKGEVVSQVIYSLDDGCAFIRKYWPDFFDASCGFHIHLSFNCSSHYACLMEPAFYNYYKESLRAFSKEQKLNRTFERRFQGKNRYCKDKFLPVEQAYSTKKYMGDNEHNLQVNPRYSALNFCFSLHGTMEIRVFSANMGVENAVAGYLWFIKMVETYLNDNYDNFMKNEKVAELDIDIPDDKTVDLNRPLKVKPLPKRESAEAIIKLMQARFGKFYTDLTEIKKSAIVAEKKNVKKQDAAMHVVDMNGKVVNDNGFAELVEELGDVELD